jgi:Ca-activated chloride channel family protein
MHGDGKANPTPGSHQRPGSNAATGAGPDHRTAADSEREWQRLVLFVVLLAVLLVTAGALNARPVTGYAPEVSTPRDAVTLGSGLAGTQTTRLETVNQQQEIGAIPADSGSKSMQNTQKSTVVLPTPPVPPARAGGRFMLTEANGDTLLAPWVDTDVDVTVSGIVARVTLRQGFLNVSEQWVAGRYTFPVPGDAAVRAMHLRVGDREIVGRIEERERAREAYAVARVSGQRAGLVERLQDDVFAVDVANVPPGERVDVVLEYVQVLALDESGMELRFPMTLMPRFDPGQGSRPAALPATIASLGASGSAPAASAAGNAAKPVVARLDAAQDYRALASVAVYLQGAVEAGSLASPSHRIAHRTAGAGIDVALRDRKVPMDRDFVLRWRPAAGEMPSVNVFTESRDGEIYALAVVVPPAQLPALTPPREMILVVDVSGSMQGDSIRQAKRAAAFALDALTPADRINVIAFNDTAQALFPMAVPADSGALRQARDFLRSLRTDGGTRMAPALERALAPPAPSHHVRQVVFVTDGAVAEQKQLIDLVAGQHGEARLFPVGIGAAPATHLMKRLAAAGRGTYTHVGSVDEVETRMASLFARLQHPVLTGIEVQWPPGAEPWPRKAPDLYAGEPLVLTARLPTAAAPAAGEEIVMSGRLGQQPWSGSVPLAPALQAPGVGVVWAQRKLAALQAGAMPALGPEGVRAAVTQIGLRHSLATPYTSFVAIERQPLRPMTASLEDTLVPSLLPAGGRRVGYPATATPAAVQLCLAAVAVLASALLWSAGSGHQRACRRSPGQAVLMGQLRR